MLRSKSVWVLAIAAIATLGFMSQALSQDAGGGDKGGDKGGRSKGGGTDWRAQAETRMKEALGVNEDEWKALQPKIEKVQTLARETRGGMMMGTPGRGGPRGGDQGGDTANRPQSEVSKKAADLQKVLQNKEAKPEEIKAALTAYREARSKAKEELEKAQKDLKDVLTARQEAVMVSIGLLE